MATTIQPVDRPRRYEERLRADLRWGMAEAERFFMGGGRVNTTLERITQRLDAIGVPCVVAEALALYLELWEQVPRRYRRIWRGGEVPADMLAAGVALEPAGDPAADYADLTTSDPAVASKYGMVEEADLWDDAGPGTTPGRSEHV